MRLAHFKGEPFCEGGTQGKPIQKTSVDAGYRDGTAFPARVDSLPQGMEAVSGQVDGHLGPVIERIDTGAMRFHSYRIDAGIGTTPPGQLLQRLADIDLLVVEDGGLMLRALWQWLRDLMRRA